MNPVASNIGQIRTPNQTLPLQNPPTHSQPLPSIKLQNGYSWRSLFREHTALKIGALAATTIVMGIGCMVLSKERKSGPINANKLEKDISLSDVQPLSKKNVKDSIDTIKNTYQDSVDDQKTTFEMCKKNMNEILQLQGEESFTGKLIDTIGGLESYCKLPELRWSYSFISNCASTYIDNIREKDTTAPVMRVIDQYNRPGIVLRTCEEGDSYEMFRRNDMSFTCNSGQKSIETIFKRATGKSGPYWVCGHHHGNCHISKNLNAVPTISSEKELNALKTLITDGKITLKNGDKELVVHLA